MKIYIIEERIEQMVMNSVRIHGLGQKKKRTKK
jgi:hypothetical protein